MQVFVTAPLDNIIRYWKRLVGVRKVLIPAGQTADVQIAVQLDDLAVYTTATPGAPLAGERRVLGGEYRVSVGGSSATDSNTASFSV